MNLQPDSVRLGWTLVHFLWQGLLIALAAAPLFWLLRRSAPQSRYALGCLALLAMTMCPFATWWVLGPETSAVVRTLPREGASGFLEIALEPQARRLEDWMPLVVSIWGTGALALLARLMGGWLLAYRHAHRAVAAAPGAVVEMAARLAARLRLRREFDVRTSLRVQVPQVFGWLKPVVLLPAASLAHLTPEQLEMVLAHELAHILRRDYLVNLLQTIAESILFYHPAVWWVSARIRAEREHCCDDMAVALCGDTLEYSRTLLALEQARPYLNPAASSGDLRSRVARIIGLEKEERMNATPMLIAVVVAGAGLLLATPPTPPDPPAPPAAPAVVAQMPPAAPPAPPPPPARAASTPRPAVAPPAPPPPPPPPPPPRKVAGADTTSSWERLTPEQKAEVKAELDRARKEIEAARGDMEREVRQAMQEAKRELERKRPELEREIKAALAEVKGLDNERLSAEIRASVEAALASASNLELQKGATEAALRSAEAALKASSAALAQVESNLSEIQRQSVTPALAPTPAAAAIDTERDRRVRFADDRWAQGDVRGSQTDRGRTYVQSGPPDQIESHPGKGESWRYNARPGKPARQVDFDAAGRKVKDSRLQ